MKNKERKSPVRSPADSAAGRTNVILEDMKVSLRMCADGIVASKEEVLRTVNERFDKVDTRLAILEGAARVHTEQIAGLKSDVGGLKSDVSGLKSDVSGLKSDVSGLKSDVSGLKSDVSGLKSDVRRIDTKLDRKADKSRVNALEEKVAKLKAG